MLKLKNVTKYYKKAKGCEDITFEVQKGTVIGFIGPNGSGKSTTIRSILGYLKLKNGKVYINNKVTNRENYEIKENIGYLPGEVNLYENLKVKEMYEYNNKFYEKDYMNNALTLSKELNISIDKKIKELSLGNLKKVDIVLALMHEPELIILDEPTNGLDPLIQEKFFEIIRKEKKRGAAILFSTHILSDVNKICDKVMLIKNGNIIEKLDVKKDNTLEISIKSNKDFEKLKKSLEKYNLTIKDKEIFFDYKGDINNLLKIINAYDLDNLIIENKLFENKLMEYYKGE